MVYLYCWYFYCRLCRYDNNNYLLRARRVFNTVQRRSVENQKGAITTHTLYSNSAFLVLNGSSLNSNNALLALIWRIVFPPTWTHDVHGSWFTQLVLREPHPEGQSKSVCTQARVAVAEPGKVAEIDAIVRTVDPGLDRISGYRIVLRDCDTRLRVVYAHVDVLICVRAVAGLVEIVKGPI